jgi:hypothetical protein
MISIGNILITENMKEEENELKKKVRNKKIKES